HRLGDLETRAVRAARGPLRRLSAGAECPPRQHVPHRRLRARSPGPGDHLPTDDCIDARRVAVRSGARPMTSLRRIPTLKLGDIRAELRSLQRRGFIKGGISLGGLALLTSCDLSTNSGVDAALKLILGFDDKAQAALFSSRRLAQTYPPSAVTRPFRFNAYY